VGYRNFREVGDVMKDDDNFIRVDVLLPKEDFEVVTDLCSQMHLKKATLVRILVQFALGKRHDAPGWPFISPELKSPDRT